MKGKNIDWNKFKRYFLLADRPLTERMLIFSALIVVIPLLVVGWISYKQSSEVLEQEARQYSWQIMNQVTNYFEDYLRDFEIDTLKIVNHSDIVAYLAMNVQDETDRREKVRNAINVLRNAAYSRSDINNISIILDEGGVIDSAGIQTRFTAASIQNEAWYEKVPRIGDPVIVGRQIEWKGRQTPVLTVAKRLVNPQTLDAFGMLLIDVNYKRLEEVARQVTPSSNGYLLIIDQEGRYIYAPNLRMVGNSYNELLWEKIKQEKTSNGLPYGSFIVSEQDQYLLTFSESSQLNWTVATWIPYDDLIQGTAYIGKTILITIAISLTLAYLIGVSFAASFVRPIKRLYAYLKKVEVGDFSHRVPVDSKDEIGMLSAGYNKMADRLSSLMDEVYAGKLKEAELRLQHKETELKALQAQINPHFLYNSLETLRGMALEKDEDEIATFAISLAKLLRYNLKEPSRIVSIAQEIEFSDLYLLIQKYRHDEKLEYEWEVPDWAMDQKIARFALQPLIENAIVHGIEPRLEKSSIRIYADKRGDQRFVLWVRDTGIGMTDNTKQSLQKDMKHKDITGGGAHLGILNVHRRIQHLFGDEYGIVFGETEGKGTLVGICLPYRFYEKRGS